MKPEQSKVKTVTGARYLPAASGALLIVFCLLYLMQMLIDVELGEPIVDAPKPLPKIIQEQAKVDEFKTEPPKKIIAPTPEPEFPQDPFEHDPTSVTTTMSPPALSGLGEIGLIGTMGDGPPILVRTAQADYPNIAIDRQLEGYVVVQFVILKDGTVDQLEVIESTSSIFERSALKAASKLRFKPQIVDGVSVEVVHQNKFTYQLES